MLRCTAGVGWLCRGSTVCVTMLVLAVPVLISLCDMDMVRRWWLCLLCIEAVYG